MSCLSVFFRLAATHYLYSSTKGVFGRNETLFKFKRSQEIVRMIKLLMTICTVHF